MTHPSTCLLIYLKYPTPGQVKRRLTPTLTPHQAADLYRCFAIDTLLKTHTLDIPLILCIDPNRPVHDYEAWLGTRHPFLPQQGDDLGARIDNSLTQTFSLGYHHLVLIGSDTPDLPLQFIKEAFHQLQTHDIVLGPANDGGYYLLGTKKDRYLPDIFTGIPWSTSSVLKDTLAIINKHHYTVSLLPHWQDTDTPDDLRDLIARNHDTAFKSSRTFTYLKNHRILEEPSA